MREKKMRTFWLGAAALLLVGSLSIPEAMAYFTTYVRAEGGYEITLGSRTDIHEDVSNMTKEITICNTGEAECYARVKVFSGSRIGITYTADEAWSQKEDGYWYYETILPAGGSSSALHAKMVLPSEDFKDSFNVIVVQECTPVLYKEDGTPYADWNAVVDTKTDIGVKEEAGS